MRKNMQLISQILLNRRILSSFLRHSYVFSIHFSDFVLRISYEQFSLWASRFLNTCVFVIMFNKPCFTFVSHGLSLEDSQYTAFALFFILGWIIIKVTRLQKMLLKKCNQILISTSCVAWICCCLFSVDHKGQ